MNTLAMMDTEENSTDENAIDALLDILSKDDESTHKEMIDAGRSHRRREIECNRLYYVACWREGGYFSGPVYLAQTETKPDRIALRYVDLSDPCISPVALWMQVKQWRRSRTMMVVMNDRYYLYGYAGSMVDLADLTVLRMLRANMLDVTDIVVKELDVAEKE